MLLRRKQKQTNPTQAVWKLRGWLKKEKETLWRRIVVVVVVEIS